MGRALMDWQRIHVGAQPDGAIALSRAQHAYHPNTFMHLKAEVAQMIGDHCLVRVSSNPSSGWR